MTGTRLATGEWHVATATRRGRYVPRPTCVTTFPRALVEAMLQTTEVEWVCEHIARHEDPAYVRRYLERQLFSHFPADRFIGRRLLDFGCGRGASSLALAQILPQTEIVGIELEATHLDVARAVQAFRGIDNVRFVQMPSGVSLPPDLGAFDFVVMSAVVEHLLPQERRVLLPAIWDVIAPGGAILISQTPHRWHPYEHHSTRRWWVNYLPDRLSLRVANRVSGAPLTWEEHLRGGIRGATETSIIRWLTRGRTGEATVVQPRLNGVRDRADYWLSGTSARYRALKVAIAALFRATDRLLGTVPAFNVDVVIARGTRA